MRKKYSISVLLLLSSIIIRGQALLPLYPGKIPNAIPNSIAEHLFGPADDPQAYTGTTAPTLQVYLPAKEKATGTAVIIFPGGAYQFLAYGAEGSRIAKAFLAKGIAAFVVKYRLPNDTSMRDKNTGPLQDAEQAIKVVRDHAAQYGLNSGRIGIIGFSAGGHLAATLATHYSNSLVENPENTSLRPDFTILVYPVISMKDELTHAGSRTNLLGASPGTELVNRFSNEEQVSAFTPPAYITHAGDDRVVNVRNSIVFYEALQRKGVDAELHLFAKGDHGFVLRLPVSEWLDPMLLWLTKEGFFTAVQ